MPCKMITKEAATICTAVCEGTISPVRGGTLRLKFAFGFTLWYVSISFIFCSVTFSAPVIALRVRERTTR